MNARADHFDRVRAPLPPPMPRRASVGSLIAAVFVIAAVVAGGVWSSMRVGEWVENLADDSANDTRWDSPYGSLHVEGQGRFDCEPRGGAIFCVPDEVPGFGAPGVES